MNKKLLNTVSIDREDVDIIRKRVKNNKPVYPIEIVGNLCRYEDIDEISDNVYRLVLGS